MDKTWLFVIQNHAHGLCLKLCELIVCYEVSNITYFLSICDLCNSVANSSFCIAFICTMIKSVTGGKW